MAFWKRRKAPAPAPMPPPPAPTGPTIYARSQSMISPVELWVWMHEQFGRGMDDRVRDAGWAWWIDAQPEGEGVWLVVKHDGAVWRLPSDPAARQLYGATNENEFREIWSRTWRVAPMPHSWIVR